MSTITILTAIFCLIIGATVLWANPHRFSNRVFAVISLLFSARNWFISEAILAGEHPVSSQSILAVLWLRYVAAVSAFLPWSLWLLKASLETDEAGWQKKLRRSIPWFGVGVLFATLSFTSLFIPSDSRPDDPKRGIFYFIHNISSLTIYLLLIIQILRAIRSQNAIQRIEMQFVALNLGTAGFLIAGVTICRAYTLVPVWTRALNPLIGFGAYALTAWAITYHRIFDARQVFIGLAQRVTLVVALSSCIYGLWQLGGKILPAPVDLVVSIVLSCSVAFWLDRRTRDWLRLDGEELLGEWRAAVLAAAKTETHPDRLAIRFEQLLGKLCQAPFAVLLFKQDQNYAAAQIAFASDRPGFAELTETGWATPENIQRRRPRPGLDNLLEFFHSHSLGVIVTSSRGVPNPSFLLAIGTKTSRWPFTYPEVRRLQTIAELMDNIISHARLSAQAALKAKIEHLALMSRGLAHDLKNLITPISSYLVYTEGRLVAASAEADVHRAAQRSVRLMTDYVREALFFSNQLQPHFEPVDLLKIFASVQEHTAAHSARHQVAVVLPPQAACSLVADTVLLQRMLGNLVRNAIDACRPGGKVKLLCKKPRDGLVRIEVIDDGCGIPAENLPRIFDAYFTTKQFGDDLRGFGLGLAITEKIVHLHHGTITVRSELGRGTTMTIEFPATQSARGQDSAGDLPDESAPSVKAP